MSEGKILFAEQDGFYFIRLLDDVRYTICQGLGNLIAQIAGDESACEVVIDLTDTRFLDSTSLGLLAKVANLSISKFNKRPVLVSCNSNVNMILNSMGFEQVFLMVESWDVSSPALFGDMTTSDAPDPRLMLEAHRTLSQMNQRNADVFHDVVELLETEVSRRFDSRSLQGGNPENPVNE